MSEQQTEKSPARNVVIVGAGMAGVQSAVALRQAGFAGPVTLIGAEPHQPYDRPPLSKAVLLGEAEHSAFDVDFEALDITLRLGLDVTALRAADHVLDTAEGPVPYDALILATGAEPITLPGSEGVPGVHLLRTLDDAARLRPVLARQHDVVVVGAGWIGAEFATAARAAGCAVTVVEAAARPLAGTLPAEVSAPHGRLVRAERRRTPHRGSGRPRRGGLRRPRGRPGAARRGRGRGHRRAPRHRLAGLPGIALGPDGSVTADSALRTSLPDVYAVGDCASFPSARYSTRLLVHHWDNALQGPRTAAASVMAAGTGAPLPVHDPVPYFWSEQFGRFVQYSSTTRTPTPCCGAATARTRPGPCVGCARAPLVAVLAVGRPRDLAQGRLIESGAALDPEKAADPAVPLKSAAL